MMIARLLLIGNDDVTGGRLPRWAGGNCGRWLMCLLLTLFVEWSPATAQFSRVIDIEKSPFQYSKSPDNNRVSRLREQLAAGELHLEHTTDRGNLQALLQALDISPSSQALVFSKTSLQVRYISGRNPRAIYFNDDTYLGWVYGSSLVEISTADPHLGTAFYTVEMSPTKPKLQRAYYDCMACHATALTQGLPGHTIRSVFPTIDGNFNAQMESFITDDRSPFSERWGGWYVTGTHGEMTHMGNAFLRGPQLDTRNSGNLTVLRDEFNTRHYLTPYSDIVALMVLEHQTQMHNTFTRADFFVRQLQHETTGVEETPEGRQEWNEQLRLIAKEVVDRMLFCGEAPLASAVQGSNDFAEQFVARGPRDSRGRSLRDFDLKTRLFRYPCSFLVHSPTFAALQSPLRKEIAGQLIQVLSAQDTSDHYQHISLDTRADMLSILRETQADALEL